MLIEKGEMLKKFKNMLKYKKQIFITFLILIIFVIFINFFIFISNDTNRIAKEIATNFNEYSIIDEKKDEDYKYSFYKSSTIYTNEINDNNAEVAAIYISKYKSNLEAKYKNQYLNDECNYMKELYKNTYFETTEDYQKQVKFCGNERLVKGIYLITISYRIKDKEKIKTSIESIIKNFNTKDKLKSNESKVKEYWNSKLQQFKDDTKKEYDEKIEQENTKILSNVELLEGCKSTECDKIVKEVEKYNEYQEFEESVNKVKVKYNEIISSKDEKINNINNLINTLNTTLNQELYNSIQNEIQNIKNLSDDYYQDSIKKWESDLSTIEEQIYKNSSAVYNYKDLLRNPNEYYNKNAYFTGKILQKIDSFSYRVGVDCKKYNYIDGYYCDNTIYVVYYGNNNFIEDDMVKIWGKMQGNKTYTTIMGASVTIPKVMTKYMTLEN